MTTFLNFLLFSFVAKFLPVCVKAWAYDTRYNAWAHCPVWGDLAQAQRATNFDLAAFQAQRAAERAAVINA